MFVFDTARGAVDITIDRTEFDGNLDVGVKLYDVSGKLLIDQGAANLATGFKIEGELLGGTYYLEVTGVGKPASAFDPGYSDYGSLGYYTISGTLPPPDGAIGLTRVEGQILRNVAGFWQPPEGTADLGDRYGYGWSEPTVTIGPIVVELRNTVGFELIDTQTITPPRPNSTLINDPAGRYSFLIPDGTEVEGSDVEPGDPLGRYVLRYILPDGVVQSDPSFVKGFEVEVGKEHRIEDYYAEYDTAFTGQAWLDTNLDGEFGPGEAARTGTFEMDVRTAGSLDDFDGEVDGDLADATKFDIRVGLDGGGNYIVTGFRPGDYDYLIDPANRRAENRVFGTPTATTTEGLFRPVEISGVLEDRSLVAATMDNAVPEADPDGYDAGFYYAAQFEGLVYKDSDGDGSRLSQIDGVLAKDLDAGLGGKLVYLDINRDGVFTSGIDVRTQTDFDDPTTYDGLGSVYDPVEGRTGNAKQAYLDSISDEAGRFSFATIPTAAVGDGDATQLLPPGVYDIRIASVDAGEDSLTSERGRLATVLLGESAGYDFAAPTSLIGIDTDSVATAAISGYVIDDRNGDGLRPSAAAEGGRVGLQVFVDLNGNREYDAGDEPITRTVARIGRDSGDALGTNTVWDGFFHFDLPFENEQIKNAEILVHAPFGETTRRFDDWLAFEHVQGGSYAGLGLHGGDVTLPTLAGTEVSYDVAGTYQFSIFDDVGLQDEGDGTSAIVVRFYDENGMRLRDITDGRVFAIDGQDISFDGIINEIRLDGRVVGSTNIETDELRFQFDTPLAKAEVDRVLAQFRYGSYFGESYLRVDVWDDEIASFERTNIWVHDSSENPLLAGAAAAPETPVYVEGGFSVVAAPAVTVSDSGSIDFNGGTLELTLTNWQSGDDFIYPRRLSSQRPDARVVLGAGRTFLIDGVAVARLTGESFGGGELGQPRTHSAQFELFEGANENSVAELIRSMRFKARGRDGVSTLVQAGERNLQITLQDGDGGTGVLNTTILVESFPDPTTLTLTAAGETFVEGGAAVRLVSGVSMSDPDTEVYDGGQLIVRAADGIDPLDRFTIASGEGLINLFDTLVLDSSNGATVAEIVSSDGELILNLSGEATPANMTKLLRLLRFENLSDNPAASRTIEFVLIDPDGARAINGLEGRDANPVTVEVAVEGVNDPAQLRYFNPSIEYRENSGPKRLSGGTVLLDPDYQRTGSLDVQYAGFSTDDDLVLVGSISGSSGTLRTLSADGLVEDGLLEEGDSVLYKGVNVGAVSRTVSGDGTGSITIDLNGTANLFAVRTIMRGLAFVNESDAPAEGVRTVEVGFTEIDGDRSTRVAGSTAVNVIAVPDRPNLTGSNIDTYLIDVSDPVVFQDGLTLTDGDGTIGGGEIEVRFLAGRTADRLRLMNETGSSYLRAGDAVTVGGQIVGTLLQMGTKVRIDLADSASVAQVEAIMNRVRFENIAPLTANEDVAREVRFRLTDGEGQRAETTVDFFVIRPPLGTDVASTDLVAAALLSDDWL